jgi:hypothetical protein
LGRSDVHSSAAPGPSIVLDPTPSGDSNEVNAGPEPGRLILFQASTYIFFVNLKLIIIVRAVQIEGFALLSDPNWGLLTVQEQKADVHPVGETPIG